MKHPTRVLFELAKGGGGGYGAHRKRVALYAGHNNLEDHFEWHGPDPVEDSPEEDAYLDAFDVFVDKYLSNAKGGAEQQLRFYGELAGKHVEQIISVRFLGRKDERLDRVHDLNGPYFVYELTYLGDPFPDPDNWLLPADTQRR